MSTGPCSIQNSVPPQHWKGGAAELIFEFYLLILKKGQQQ
tara:strand:+ start:192 stop:311 length:120 start_codon:yes stop_codon:yes gene_type:complete